MKAKDERINNIEVAIRQAENSISNIKEMTDELRQELSEEQEEKTYPIGHDPDGEWSIGIRDRSVGELSLAAYKFNDDRESEEEREFAFLKGQRFTTKEQAEKAAAGKNAMRELVMVIHDFKTRDFVIHKCVDLKIYSESLQMWQTHHVPSKFIDKLGEKKIKLALEQGI
jgi:hypothetical protein